MIIDISAVIGAIVQIGTEAAIKNITRQEAVIRILERLKLDNNIIADDFDAIYAATLVHYGVFKPRSVLNFFNHKYIRQAFREAFYKQDPSILEREIEGILSWNKETNELGHIEQSIYREVAAFNIMFNEIVNSTQTPSAVRHEQTIKQGTDEILERLQKLDTLDEIQVRLSSLLENVSVAPSPTKKLEDELSEAQKELARVREELAFWKKAPRLQKTGLNAKSQLVLWKFGRRWVEDYSHPLIDYLRQKDIFSFKFYDPQIEYDEELQRQMIELFAREAESWTKAQEQKRTGRTHDLQQQVHELKPRILDFLHRQGRCSVQIVNYTFEEAQGFDIEACNRALQELLTEGLIKSDGPLEPNEASLLEIIA